MNDLNKINNSNELIPLIHASVTVWQKWQIVIPKNVRDELGINPGDVLMTITQHSKVVCFMKTDELESFIEFMQQQLQQFKKQS